MDGTVAKLILDSLDKEENHSGTLGGVFLKYIDSLKPTKETPSSDRDIILETKLKNLKQCELNNDLGWFDYDSWNTLPLAMQEFFTAKVDPLYYGGVYFQYSELLKIEDEFWCQLPPTHSVTILNDSNNYRIHSIGNEDRRYDRMGIQALQHIQRNFTTNTIMSIGTTSLGKVVKIDRRIKNNE